MGRGQAGGGRRCLVRGGDQSWGGQGQPPHRHREKCQAPFERTRHLHCGHTSGGEGSSFPTDTYPPGGFSGEPGRRGRDGQEPARAAPPCRLSPSTGASKGPGGTSGGRRDPAGGCPTPAPPGGPPRPAVPPRERSWARATPPPLRSSLPKPPKSGQGAAVSSRPGRPFLQADPERAGRPAFWKSQLLARLCLQLPLPAAGLGWAMGSPQGLRPSCWGAGLPAALLLSRAGLPSHLSPCENAGSRTGAPPRATGSPKEPCATRVAPAWSS